MSEQDQSVDADAQRPNRADRRASKSKKQHKHGTTAQMSPFDIALAPTGSNQQQRAIAAPPSEPSRHGDRAYTDADAEPPLPIEANAGNFLRGSDAIREYLVSLGFPENVDVYYLKRSGWPIGNSGGDRGGFLIASKRRLTRHLERLASS
jgi:hypothetical protein